MSVATTSPFDVASGATVTSNSRSTGTRSLHCTVSASPLAITRRRASMTSGARKPSTKGSPILRPGNRSSAGLLAAAARSSALTITAGSGIAPMSCSRERRPHKLSEFPRLEALHRPAGQSSDGFDIASRSERQRRVASTPPSIAIAMRKGTA